ncbi:RsmB/NOP family class I SAM-dependent RNA methyltransferase [Sphingomonas glaciei]|uniref:RsmB/NOP family class I SAM-dependent RNA methyltransferase n=1 Tax=Sphingomonas glaciei TaxID=2938948 RepID=A0ABY5MRY5_9SPHN|nr:RsmB/NOP family class I SAM-dependent RNA methyltransferase [Sphingomonas glaciei]UUR07255.1 RsmB/NOP family class I SAM-dependent RNA methyltransferase [Sphingomonas glaciei]
MRQPQPRGPEAGVGARRSALRILDRVVRSGQTMDSAAQGLQKLEPADQALALAIAGETLRRLPLLDRLIDGATRQILPDDAKARMVLRLALAQRIALKVPDHALVATALPLVEGGPRRLVHGVLGTLLRGALPEADEGALPQAVENRWTAAWGQQAVDAARRAIVRRPPLDLSFRSHDEALSFAGAEGGISLAERHVRLSDTRPVTGLPGFAEGRWWIQDLSSTLPARMIPADAFRVLDACAAPGGKTLQIAAAGHRTFALDRSESRLARLRANLARTGLQAQIVTEDVLGYNPDEPFDAVLLDAPCSATGTFRRHPEVLLRASDRIIAESAELQGRLLTAAAAWVRPGGSLVYAVCSLEPQEGEEIIAEFLRASPDYSLAEQRRVLPGEVEEEGGMDGFFAARLVRAG